MKKGNILIEALLGLSILILTSSMMTKLFIDTEQLNKSIDPFNELENDCLAQCTLEKLTP